MPKEMETAIRRLEAGEDPNQVEADMSDVLGDFMGGPEGEPGEPGKPGGGGSHTHDGGLYDM